MDWHKLMDLHPTPWRVNGNDNAAVWVEDANGRHLFQINRRVGGADAPLAEMVVALVNENPETCSHFQARIES